MKNLLSITLLSFLFACATPIEGYQAMKEDLKTFDRDQITQAIADIREEMEYTRSILANSDNVQDMTKRADIQQEFSEQLRLQKELIEDLESRREGLGVGE